MAEALAKVLVEHLKIVKDVEIEVKGDSVRFKLYDLIYANFCVLMGEGLMEKKISTAILQQR